MPGGDLMKERHDVDGISRGDFLDEPGAAVEIRKIRSGRGSVSPGGASRKLFRGSRRGDQPLEPEAVCAEGGRLGWRVRLPGGRPLATPAVAGGRVFIGGGFGSHELYAFSASDGRLLWKIGTRDDGPTAATVAGEHVAFNTESCTVFVVDAGSGRVLWETWLGDPLMGQTAIHGNTLFAAYPDRERRHWLGAFELSSGKPRWRSELVADVISAPVVAEGSVFATTLDGTVHRFDAESGTKVWAEPQRATSAPWIHRGRIYVSLRGEEEAEGRLFATEGYDTVSMTRGVRSEGKASSRRRADYLKYEKAAQDRLYQALESSVGFSSPPSTAKLHLAAEHLGVGHVASVWAYQGSRPEVFDDGIFGVLDNVVHCMDVGTKKPLWRVQVEVTGERRAPRVLSPPAVTATRLHVTSSFGDLLVLDRRTGDEVWSLNLAAPIASQPAVAEGKVFVGTADGTLYAFETEDAGSWSMWGGGPGHNGEVPE
jgi:Ca-activated chloride channel family protein